MKQAIGSLIFNGCAVLRLIAPRMPPSPARKDEKRTAAQDRIPTPMKNRNVLNGLARIVLWEEREARFCAARPCSAFCVRQPDAINLFCARHKRAIRIF